MLAPGTASRIRGAASSRTSTPFPRRNAATVPTTSPGARSTAGHAGAPLWTTTSRRGRSRFARARSRSKSHTQISAAVSGRQRPLDDQPEHPPRLPHLPHEREAVRRVDHGAARREAREHTGLRRVRVHHVVAAQLAHQLHERSGVVPGMRVVAPERKGADRGHADGEVGRCVDDRLVAVIAETPRELADVLGGPAVGGLADQCDPRHGRRV